MDTHALYLGAIQRLRTGEHPPAVSAWVRTKSPSGFLSPIRESGARTLCKCACGAVKSVLTYELNGGTLSCGCWRRMTSSRIGSGQVKHGLEKSNIYNVWHGMMRRCYDTNSDNYHRYGGRGIRVCPRWHDIRMFAADVGTRPARHSLGRIRNNEDYGPENCRWETQLEQMNNCSINKFVTHMGESLTLAQWARRFGLKYSAFYRRYRSGWPMMKIEMSALESGGSKHE